MNPYKYHSKPESLKHHSEAIKGSPSVVFDRLRHELRNERTLTGRYTQKGIDEFKKYEDVLLKDPMVAANYCYFILRNRYEKAESIIATNVHASLDYANIDHREGNRFVKGEKIILAKGTLNDICRYAMNSNWRWIDAEDRIEQALDTGKFTRDPHDNFDPPNYCKFFNLHLNDRGCFEENDDND